MESCCDKYIGSRNYAIHIHTRSRILCYNRYNEYYNKSFYYGNIYSNSTNLSRWKCTILTNFINK